MIKKTHLLILIFLISFGSVTCVAFTPTLPSIVEYFGISAQKGEWTIIIFLAGYALGQLLYGPIANRFGSRRAIQITATFTMLAAIGCILSHQLHSFQLLLMARFILALGAGGGLTLAVIVTSKLFDTKNSARILSLLTIGFSVPPAIAVFICSFLLVYFDWSSAFYFTLTYGLWMFFLAFYLPEVIVEKKRDALNPTMLWHNYKKLLSKQTIFGGLLIGVMTSFVFVFADLSPFISIQMMNTNPKLYGIYNLIPMAGMITGAILANVYSQQFSPKKMIHIGLYILAFGGMILMLALYTLQKNDLSLFLPMFIIYIGFSFVYGNAVSRALAGIEDKSNAVSIIHFINMSTATSIVLILKSLTVYSNLLLPAFYGVLTVVAVFWHFLAIRYEKN